jgi:hypothetical protein
LGHEDGSRGGLMPDSRAFDWLCGALTRATSFSEIEARGTVRIALKKSGLAAADVRPAQLQVVLKRVLPDELRRRGCDGAEAICDELAVELKDQGFEAERDTPEDVFARLGSS